VSTIYVTLSRHEDQGFVTSRNTDPEPGRGRKGKRFYELTPEGLDALHSPWQSLQNLRKGVSPA